MWVHGEVVPEFAEDRPELAEEDVQLFQVAPHDCYFGEVVLHPFEVFLLVLPLIADNLVDVFALGQFLHFGRAHFLAVLVALLLEGVPDGAHAFLEGDSVGVEEGVAPGLDGLLVLVLLLFVEGGQLGLVVDDFLGVLLVGLLLLLDPEGQVRELEVLLLQPVNDVDVVVALAGRLVLV